MLCLFVYLFVYICIFLCHYTNGISVAVCLTGYLLGLLGSNNVCLRHNNNWQLPATAATTFSPFTVPNNKEYCDLLRSSFYVFLVKNFVVAFVVLLQLPFRCLFCVLAGNYFSIETVSKCRLQSFGYLSNDFDLGCCCNWAAVHFYIWWRIGKQLRQASMSGCLCGKKEVSARNIFQWYLPLPECSVAVERLSQKRVKIAQILTHLLEDAFKNELVS